MRTKNGDWNTMAIALALFAVGACDGSDPGAEPGDNAGETGTEGDTDGDGAGDGAGDGTGDGTGDGDGDGTGDGDGDGDVATGDCPEGEVVVGLGDSMPICGSFEPVARDAMNDGCRAHLGWVDACGDCTDPPQKLGYAGDDGCETVSGGTDTCGSVVLGSAALSLFGLNTDGAVNGDDRFFAGWNCEGGDDQWSQEPASCPDGTVATGLSGAGELICTDLSMAVIEWANDRCELTLGWRDTCENCTNVPTEWSTASGISCAPGAGNESDCLIVDVQGADVPLASLGMSGGVDFNDAFFIGLTCRTSDEDMEDATGNCPSGSMVTGIGDGGVVVCTPVENFAADYAREHCKAYLGWRDDCDGCTDPPTRWASAGSLDCGTGSSSNCVTASIDGLSRPLSVFNTDGTVDENDKFYVGMQCE